MCDNFVKFTPIIFLYGMTGMEGLHVFSFVLSLLFFQHFAQLGVDAGDSALMVNGLSLPVDDLNPFQ